MLESSNTPSSSRPALTPSIDDDDEQRTVADRELQLVPDHLPSTSSFQVDQDIYAPSYLGDDVKVCSFRDQMMANHHGYRIPSKSKNNIQSILRTSVLYHVTKAVPGGKFLLAERNIGYVLGSFSLLGIIVCPNDITHIHVHATYTKTVFSYKNRRCVFQQHSRRDIRSRFTVVSVTHSFFLKSDLR